MNVEGVNVEGPIGCHVHRCNLCGDEVACAFTWCASLRVLACSTCRRAAWDARALDRVRTYAARKGA